MFEKGNSRNKIPFVMALFRATRQLPLPAPLPGIEMAIIHLTITVSQLENDIGTAHDAATDAEPLCPCACPAPALFLCLLLTPLPDSLNFCLGLR